MKGLGIIIVWEIANLNLNSLHMDFDIEFKSFRL